MYELSKEKLGEKRNPYEPILQKAGQNLPKLKASLKLKQQFFQEMRDTLLKESINYQKISRTRLNLQAQIRALTADSAHSQGVSYDVDRVERIKNQFMTKFEVLKSEMINMSSEVCRVKLEAQSFLSVLGSFGKNAPAAELLQLVKEKEKELSDKEGDILDLQYRYFKENCKQLAELERKRNLPQAPQKSEAPKAQSRFQNEEQLLAKFEASMGFLETWLVEEIDNNLQEITNLNSTISQIEFMIAGKLDGLVSEPANLQEEFAQIIETIVKTDEYFYEEFLFAFAYFLALEGKSMFLNKFIMSGLVQESLENLLHASKSVGYLQNLLLGVTHPGHLEHIENFTKAYRDSIFATIHRNLNEYLVDTSDSEVSERRVAELLAPSFKKTLLAADLAKEKISLYLDSLKSERNKHWLCYSISAEYLPTVMKNICPLLMKIDDYRYPTLTQAVRGHFLRPEVVAGPQEARVQQHPERNREREAVLAGQRLPQDHQRAPEPLDIRAEEAGGHPRVAHQDGWHRVRGCAGAAEVDSAGDLSADHDRDQQDSGVPCGEAQAVLGRAGEERRQNRTGLAREAA